MASFERWIEKYESIMGIDGNRHFHNSMIQAALQEVLSDLEGKIWKSVDFRTTEQVELPPKNLDIKKPRTISVPIKIPEDNIPKALQQSVWIPRDNRLCHISIRSRLAQIGVGSPRIHEAMWLVHQTKYDEQSIELINYSPRPIIIPKNFEVGRIFSFAAATLLKDDRLDEALQRSDLSVGEAALKHRDYQGSVNGLYIPIAANNRLTFLPSDEPIMVTDGPVYREAIRQQMVPVEVAIDEYGVNPKTMFWIGQTASKIVLPEDLDVFIAVKGQLPPQLPNSKQTPNLLHTQSPLLDGGRTNWPIKVELVGNPDELQYVLFHFFQSQLNDNVAKS